MLKDILKTKIRLLNKMFESPFKKSDFLNKIIIELSILSRLFYKICEMQYEDVKNILKKFMLKSYV